MDYGKFQFWAFIILTPIVFIRSEDKIIGFMIASFSLCMAGIAYQSYKELQYKKEHPEEYRRFNKTKSLGG